MKPIVRLTSALALIGILFAAAPAAAITDQEEMVQKAHITVQKVLQSKDIGHYVREYLKQAKGVLVFPKVFKAGFGFGGEYGEGALRIKGKTVDYYSTAAASFGFQIGVQKKSIILLFTQQAALKHFRESSGWKAGVDGSVALATLGAGENH